MKSKIISIVKYITMLALGILLLWLATKNVDIKTVYEQIKNARWIWVWISLVFSILAFVSRAVRWNIMLEPAGYKPTTANTTYAVMLAYFANLALPRIGEVTRCGSLSKKEKIPFDILIGTVIAERAIDTITLLSAMLILLITQYQIMSNFLFDNIFSKFNFNFGFVGIAVILIVLITFFFGLRFLFNSKKFAGFKEKILLFLKGVITGLKAVKNIKSFGWFVFHSIFIWVLYYLSVWACFYALDATSGLGWNEALFALVAGGIGMAAPVQGGIGTYELFVSKGLFLFGINEQDGVTFALLVHATQIGMIIVCGLFAFFMIGFTKDRNAKIN